LGRGGGMMQVMTGVMAVVGFQKKSRGELGVSCGWDGEGTTRGEGRRRAVDPWGDGVRRRSGGAG
jgi:hypothetical protein